MALFSNEVREALLANGARSATGEALDPFPIVKLFTPDANAIWLLTELDPNDPDRAFGLCDLGLGCPELGPVLMSEVEVLRGPSGLSVEVDAAFRATQPLSRYAAAARLTGCITT